MIILLHYIIVYNITVLNKCILLVLQQVDISSLRDDLQRVRNKRSQNESAINSLRRQEDDKEKEIKC